MFVVFVNSQELKIKFCGFQDSLYWWNCADRRDQSLLIALVCVTAGQRGGGGGLHDWILYFDSFRSELQWVMFSVSAVFSEEHEDTKKKSRGGGGSVVRRVDSINAGGQLPYNYKTAINDTGIRQYHPPCCDCKSTSCQSRAPRRRELLFVSVSASDRVALHVWWVKVVRLSISPT